MEKYWAIISWISGMAHIVLASCLFCRFAKPYLNNRSYVKILGIAYFAVMAALYCVPWEMDGTIAYGIGALAALMVMCFVDRRNRRQKLFLVITMFLLDWAAAGVANIFRFFIFEKTVYQPYVQRRHWLQLGVFAGTELLYAVLYFAIMSALIGAVNKVYVGKKENMTGKELALMLATPLLVFTGYWAFQFFSNAWLGTFEHYIWNVYSQYLWLKALYQAAVCPAVITTVILYQKIKEGYRREKENAVLAGQMEDMKKHIGQLEAVYSDIRGLKHDIGNHILTLEALLHKNERQQAEEYLLKFKEKLRESSDEIKTGNPVTDVILTEKKKEAQKMGVDFLCDFHYPEGTGINAFDVSVILNNGIDNALEAAGNAAKETIAENGGHGSRPYVRIRSWRQKNAYMIEITNPFAGSLSLNRESGLPESSKVRGGHGFGLVNIRKVAQQYLGEIDVLQRENIFVLSVMLMIKEDKKCRFKE
ncbi:MAG: GHKL domain-containing protein [Clostridium sp.]|nr:GHKL domain-containing protein [Clostridium sp.]